MPDRTQPAITFDDNASDSRAILLAPHSNIALAPSQEFVEELESARQKENTAAPQQPNVQPPPQLTTPQADSPRPAPINIDQIYPAVSSKPTQAGAPETIKQDEANDMADERIAARVPALQFAAIIFISFGILGMSRSSTGVLLFGIGLFLLLTKSLSQASLALTILIILSAVSILMSIVMTIGGAVTGGGIGSIISFIIAGAVIYYARYLKQKIEST